MYDHLVLNIDSVEKVSERAITSVHSRDRMSATIFPLRFSEESTRSRRARAILSACIRLDEVGSCMRLLRNSA